MTYAKLKRLADDMSPEELTANLKSLVNDNRFAAVVKLILDQKELSSDSACQLKFAPEHGLLAHAAGVRYCALEMEGRIKAAADPVKKRGAQPAVEKG